ncbi:CotS family spore coat protein [Brevibacillus invocatus]|uniref:CotS family spore coat protein n=1 Tax=Brevibacillus invocatus TaxID=173959 RepID=A0A3M8C924_9BACL|nr:CotS family spore coat protein [Brevibacillus invocatus]RNB72214.1 CotS family spore coat protein [Brevibacillus invocatus]
MEEYLIKPWDIHRQGTGAAEAALNWDMHVPPEIDTIAEAVIKMYDMSVSSRTLITSKPDKGGAIWRIETNKGPRSLKLLHRSPERSLFSVGLQEYVVKQGARVPALIPAKDGKLFVEMGGKLWIVTDWINLQPATKVDLVGAQELCYGLGEFHRHTKGYLPPLGAKNSSRLYRWPNYYQKIAKKIGWMREMASAYSETAASPEILSVVDEYERQAQEAITRLQQSAYSKMAAMGEPHWGLVHQDYGWSNGQNGPGGLWVIDLDGVSYDLPFRDLRKLITSTMDDMGVWDVGWMRGMIEAYHKANPLDAESFDVLLIDMAMPNEFYKHLKEMFFDPVTFLNTEAGAILQRVVATDQTKWQALAELSKDKSKYAAGSYEQAAVAQSPEKIPSQASSTFIWEQKQWNLQTKKRADQTEKEAVSASSNDKQKSSKKENAPKRETVAVPFEEKKTESSQQKQKKPESSEPKEKQKVESSQSKQKKDAVKDKVAELKPVEKKSSSNPAAEEKEAVRSSASRRKSLTSSSASNVINLLPYLSNPGTRTPRAKTAASGRKRQASLGTVRSKRKSSGAAAKAKRTTTVRALQTKRTEASRAIAKKRQAKPLSSARTASRLGQKSTSTTKPRRAATTSASSRHGYNKVPAPRNRVTTNPARKPKAKQGMKKYKGLR